MLLEAVICRKLLQNVNLYIIIFVVNIFILEVSILKEFFIRNKKTIFRAILLLLTLFVVSLTSMLMLWGLDIIYFDDGIKLNIELFNAFKNSWYGWLVIILMQVVLSTLLCFVPAFSMAFILLMQTLFDYAWQAFIAAFIGVMLTSLFMYLTGRFGGYKLCKKILGEKDCQRASELLNNKGAVFFPLMMLFPMFPDDALVMIAGTLKMSLAWFIPSIVVGRGVGIATIVFGLAIIPYDKFTTVWHWIAFVAVSAILIFAVFFMAYKFNAYLEKRKKEGRAAAQKKKCDKDTV